ncbi:RING finger protein 17 [Plakobranchus ocellatus]|uniref:RING finger protein 17 n=1 Tax=Plakobranchus ocellatus TaxID=259542 RepID=A0AAV4C191_9GAST|nr:RING finger protein 17 [Plakobranchus ocellatus]
MLRDITENQQETLIADIRKGTAKAVRSEDPAISSSRNGTSKVPLLLRCGHTFCESCLASKIVKKKECQGQHLCCPTCKQISFLQNGVKDLPTNFYLFARLEVGERSKLELTLGEFVPDAASQRKAKKGCPEFFVRKCKICEKVPASCKCLECDNIMCLECFDKFHRASAAIKNHQPVPLIVEKSKTQSPNPNCEEHGRLIEYFCTDDNTAICSRCYIVGSHRNHSITSYEEKNKELLNDIENEIETAQNVVHLLERADYKLASFIPDLEREMKKVIENISEGFIGMHTLLQVREMEIIESLTKIIKDSSITLDEQRELFSINRSNIETSLKDAKMLIENNALVIDSVGLLENLRAAKSTPCLVVKKNAVEDESYLQWNETSKRELVQAVESYGSVSGSVLHNFEFLSLANAPPGFELEDQEVDDRTSVASSFSASNREKFHRLSSTISSSDGVIIENSDADSDISRPSKQKPAAPSVTTKQPFQEMLAVPVVKGKPERVSVTHICSPNDFLVQLETNSRKLQTLSHNINIWCRREASARHMPSQVDVGTFVLARYSEDKTWYRAKVLGLVEDHSGSPVNPKVHVQYIDFGNEEVVGMRELRSMEKRFMIYPVFTVRCSLRDLAPSDEQKPWSADAIREFQRITENQVFLLSTFAVRDQLYEVDLVCIRNEDVLDDGDVSVRDTLVFLELARFNVHSDAAKHLPSPASYTKVDFIKNRQVSLHGLTPQLVQFSLVQGKSDIPYQEQTGNRQSCGCRLNSDGRMQPPQETSLQVCQVTSAALQYQSGKTSQTVPQNELSCRPAVLSSNQNLTVKKWSERVEVVLWLGSKVSAPANQSINFLLVESGLAISTGLSSVGATQESLYESGADTASVRYGTSRGRNVAATAAGSRGVAKKPATRPIAVAGGRSGSSSSTSSSTVDTPKAFAKPKVSDTSPKKTQPSSGASNTAVVQEKINDSSKSRKTRAQKQPKKSSQVAKESALQEKQRVQKDIQRALSNDGSASEDNSGTLYIEVIISSYESPSNFVLRIKDKEDQLGTLMESMQTEYKNSSPLSGATWQVDEFCAARFSEDGLWYRGKILTSDPASGCLVEMVDYGYQEVVSESDLRPLSRPLGEYMECAAVRCHIANLVAAGSAEPSKWSRTAIEFMKAETKDRKLFIKQEGDVNDLGLPIDIILETEIPETAFDPAIRRYHSLRQAILDKGLAMPDRRKTKPSSPDSSAFQPFQRLVYEKPTPAPMQAAEPAGAESKQSESDPVEDLSFGELMESLSRASADPNILPPYPALTVGEPLEVFPIFVDYSGIIYVQPKEWEDMVIHLDHELQRIYSSMNFTSSKEWQLDQVCVAYYPVDDRWYRAIVLEVFDGEVKVRYIDYGNTEIVKTRHICEMLPEFAKVHPLALYCELYDIVPSSLDGKWPEPVLEYVHELMVNAWCRMVIVKMEGNSHVQVELTKTSGLNLGSHLVEQSMASRVSDLSPEYKRSGKISQILATHYPFPSLDVTECGEMFRATLTHVELPNLIYVQRVRIPDTEELDFVKSADIAKINSLIDDFEQMTEKLNSSQSMPLSQLPDEGFMCAAKYSYDGVWYRGLVVESYKGQGACLILYVDFGTSEVVPMDRLRLLLSEFWTLPAQAIRIYFNIIPPSGPRGLWQRDSINAVIQALACKEIMVRITQTDPLTAELLMEGENGEMRLAYESVIEAGLALLPGSVEGSTPAPGDSDKDVIVEGTTEQDQGKERQEEIEDVNQNFNETEQAEAGDFNSSPVKVDWWASNTGEKEGASLNPSPSRVDWWASDTGEGERADGSIEACVNDEAGTAAVDKEEGAELSSSCSSGEWTTDDDDDDDEVVEEGVNDITLVKEPEPADDREP